MPLGRSIETRIDHGAHGGTEARRHRAGPLFACLAPCSLRLGGLSDMPAAWPARPTSPVAALDRRRLRVVCWGRRVARFCGRSATGPGDVRPWRFKLTRTARRTEKRRMRRGAGLETLADMAAIAFLVLGFVVALGLLMTFSLSGLVASGSALIGAFLQWLLLRCLAEHLRLQKKIAGCEFEGAITGPSEEIIWACSNCGQMLHSDDRCESCGAQIALDDC